MKPCDVVCYPSGYDFMMNLEKIPAGVYAWHIGPSLGGLPGETVPGFVKEAH